MKTYEIKYEPVNIDGINIPKYNIYYYDSEGKLETKEFHSIDGINGEIKNGYKIKENANN